MQALIAAQSFRSVGGTTCASVHSMTCCTRPFVLPILALTLAGCGGDALDVDLTGTWRGGMARGFGNTPSDREPYTLTLFQNDRTLSGKLCRDEAKRCSDIESGTFEVWSNDESSARSILLRTVQPASDNPGEGPPGLRKMLLELSIRRTTEPVSLLSGESFVTRGSGNDMLSTSFVR